MKNIILLVDDSSNSLRRLSAILSPEYDVRMAKEGRAALKLVENDKPDLILLDILMPGMDGFEVLARLKENPETGKIPVIFITGLADESDEEKGFLLGAADYIRKPFKAAIVKLRVDMHLRLKASADYLRDKAAYLSRELHRRAEEVVAGQETAIMTMASLAEERDSDTGYHLYRTQHYVRVLAFALRDHPRFRHYLDDKTIDLLYKSAPLHDIGKIGVPDGILLKPGRLTAEERKTMERHPVIGRDAIRNAEKRLGRELDFLVYAKEIIYCHHEKWDGSGYPEGIAGDAIPVSARLMALADVYDALVSRRIYKAAFSHAEARQIILAGSGSHFDPDVVAAFLEKEQEFIEISRRFADN